MLTSPRFKFEKEDLISPILMFLLSTLNSINVPPLKSIPKFNPLNEINTILSIKINNEKIFAFLNKDEKLKFLLIII